MSAIEDASSARAYHQKLQVVFIENDIQAI
jgi:hypothetical protein